MNEDRLPESEESTQVTELKPESPPAIIEPEQSVEAVVLKTVSRFFQLVLLGLVLVLVAFISALTAMRIAIHGREIEVPKLIGMTPIEAEAALGDRGLRLEVESRFYGTEVSAGRVISQSPAPGTAVRRGWRVRVAESLGPPRATVPNVIGQSSRAAEINVRRRGLEVGKLAVVHLPNLPGDQVVAMSPPPESMGNSPKVSLLLTASEESEAFMMPNLVGKTALEVQKLIDKPGLRLANPSLLTATSAEKPRRVRNQIPAAGSKVNRGTLVELEMDR